MVISQQEMDLILNPKIRRRTLAIPIKRGPMGELKRPPKQGGVHRLKVAVPYVRYREECQSQPTRARSVLALIARCDRPSKDVTITILTKPVRETKDGVDVWSFTFEKGDHAALQDVPVFLAKSGGDYTTTPSRQSVPGDPEVLTPLASDLAKARAKALERRVTPQHLAVARMTSDVQGLRKSLEAMKARNRLRRIEHDLKELARELPSSEMLDSQLTVARDDQHADAARHHCDAPLASPEAA